MPESVLTLAPLVVAVAALVLVSRLLRDLQLLRSEAQAVEAYSLRLERDMLQLQKSLSLDPLTGLGNSQRLEEDWRRLVARSERRAEPFAAVVVDVSNSGSGEGGLDRRRLTAIAATLLHEARIEDHVYRVGPQSFVVFLSGSDRAGAGAFVVRVRGALAAGTAAGAICPASCAMTFGTAQWERSLGTLEALLARARADQGGEQDDRDEPPAGGSYREPVRIAARLGRMSGPRRAGDQLPEGHVPGVQELRRAG